MRVKRSVGIKLIRINNFFHIYDLKTRKFWDAEVLKHRSVVILLLLGCRWTEQDELIKKSAIITGTDEKDVEEILLKMIEIGIFITEKDSAKDFADDEKKWSSFGWEEAFLFHLHTNLIPKMDYSLDPKGIDDKNMMNQYLAEELPPSNYKNIAEREMLLLSKPLHIKHKPLQKIFTDSCSPHKTRSKITSEEFSWLLYLAFGETSSRKLPITGKHIAKTSPSGGSRHPTEVYLIVDEMENVKAGLYHYNVEKHGITVIKLGNFSNFIKQHIITHHRRLTFIPQITFIFSTVFERSMFRYRESRSYRVVNHDIGHLMQTTAYLANALNFSFYQGYSLHDSQVEEFIQIDGLYESVMTYMTIG